MGCLGVHFALKEESIRKLKCFESERERLAYFREEIEEEFFGVHREWLQETDKAWDGIHRALTDGELSWANGSYPLNHVILGGELLYPRSDHILTMKTKEQVREIAAALKEVTKDKLMAGYTLITSENCDWDPSD